MMSESFKIEERRDGRLPCVRISGACELDVGRTFDCGQCFRFDRVERSAHECEFGGVAFGRYVSFAQDGSDVFIYNSDLADFERIWRDFLCLDMDYSQINRDILEHSGGGVMERAIERGRGIRILRQDPYETTVSFIISQNNNIPRIKKIIEGMSGECGTRIEIPSQMEKHVCSQSSLCSFPDANALYGLGEEGLYAQRMGFRARYVYDLVRRIVEGEMSASELADSESTAECIEKLMRVKGIGLKVASCAALFGFGRYDAFPVDVWIKRVAEKYFPSEAEFNGSLFGKYAGIAQQYLFYYERYEGGEEKN